MGCISGKPKLSKSDLDFLLTHTHYSEDAIRKWFQKFTVECPDGNLYPDAFIIFYKKLFPKENAEDFCKHVFRTFDTDGNGWIDFKEFLFAIDSLSTATPEDKLRRSFRMYDVNGNGYITLEEMVKVMEAFCDMLGPAGAGNGPVTVNKFSIKKSAKLRAERIFRTLDLDHDGQVSEEEFLQGCLQDEEFSQILQLEQNLNKVMLSLL